MKKGSKGSKGSKAEWMPSFIPLWNQGGKLWKLPTRTADACSRHTLPSLTVWMP
jgi:hypothetical protein